MPTYVLTNLGSYFGFPNPPVNRDLIGTADRIMGREIVTHLSRAAAYLGDLAGVKRRLPPVWLTP